MSRGDGFQDQFQFLLSSFAQTPIVVAVGLYALARKRNHLLLAGFLVALVFAFGTKVYRLRVLYLLPYFTFIWPWRPSLVKNSAGIAPGNGPSDGCCSPGPASRWQVQPCRV